MKRHCSYCLLFVVALSLSGCSLPWNAKNNSTSPNAAANPSSLTAGTPATNNFSIDIKDSSDQPSLNIPGTVAPGQKIYINGKEVTNVDNNGNFNATVDLQPGINHVIVKVVSKDSTSIYNMGKDVTFTPKAQQPSLSITNPNPIPQAIQFTSENSLLVITGTTDPNCQINANGIKTTADEKGNFIVKVPLSHGEYILKITATNSQGIITTLQNVINCTQNPILHVIPDQNGNVSSQSFTISGFTDPNNLIEIYNNYTNQNGKIKSLIFRGNVNYDGRFSVDTSLINGVNQITVIATNQYGISTTPVTKTITFKDSPKVESMSVSPQKPALNGTVTFNVYVSDDQPGVKNVSIEYVSPVTNTIKVIDLAKDPKDSHLWKISNPSSLPLNEEGLWTLYAVNLLDNGGTWHRFYKQDIPTVSITDFTVENPQAQ